MIWFEMSHDKAAIEAILTAPSCYSKMANDAAPPREQFAVDKLPISVLAYQDGRTVAVFMLCPLNPAEAEIHFCFIPESWGKTRHISLLFIDWAWRNTGFDRLIGKIPSYNRLCLKLAQSVGFRTFDVRLEQGKKNGVDFYHILTDVQRPS